MNSAAEDRKLGQAFGFRFDRVGESGPDQAIGSQFMAGGGIDLAHLPAADRAIPLFEGGILDGIGPGKIGRPAPGIFGQGLPVAAGIDKGACNVAGCGIHGGPSRNIPLAGCL